jgi:hypothetical protein
MSKVADQSPARERLLTVLLRHADTYDEGRGWVDSRRLVQSYMGKSCTSGFERILAVPDRMNLVPG